MSAERSYDVALSYLREEHADDARELATRLRKAGYSVFFDEFEEAEVWGQIIDPLTVARGRPWTQASEEEWQAVNDPHNAVLIPLMPLPAA